MPNRLFVPLLYHELRPDAAAYSYVLSCRRFQEELALLHSLPAGAYSPVVTFDDGHLSNYTEAAPALERFGTKAHFFITVGWTGTRTAYMEPKHLRALHDDGHTIGAHGWTHSLLTQCSPSALRHELQDARAALEDHIGAPVTSLSLPGGRSNARVFAACQEAGYASVWTSTPGATASVEAPRVGRFNVLAGHTDAFLTGLMDPASGKLARAARISRYKAAAQRAMGDRLYARLWALLNRKEGDANEPAAQVAVPESSSRGAAR